MSCLPTTITIDNIEISTSDFENARELLETVSDDTGDPTSDGYDENIANGNNTSKRTGVQFPGDKQTSLPGIITEKPSASSDKKPTYKPGVDVSCDVWNNDYNYQLSPNFSVKDFSIGALWKNQITDFSDGSFIITKSERVCNLKGLAQNVAEAMFAKFGPFRINSGIRNKNTSMSGLSQHVKGEAMDIQFIGWSYDRYWENAAWVRDNVPYDQFIFEHSSTSGLAWYHLSFKRNGGNRPADDRTKVMTMYRNNYDSGLKRFG